MATSSFSHKRVQTWTRNVCHYQFFWTRVIDFLYYFSKEQEKTNQISQSLMPFQNWKPKERKLGPILRCIWLKANYSINRSSLLVKLIDQQQIQIPRYEASYFVNGDPVVFTEPQLLLSSATESLFSNPFQFEGNCLAETGIKPASTNSNMPHLTSRKRVETT